jgi:crotonobetainyl-CoA:carnitine CoA-transferase CaiB-like acyl-CoA transferase
MLFDDQVATVTVPGLGQVREPKPFVRLQNNPGSAFRPVPQLNQHGAELRNRASAPVKQTSGATRALTGLPLEGITIVELGSFYAAPFGLCLLADLGARVIKVEPLEGDPIRFQLPFPELAGVKVTQGKQGIAVDIGNPVGHAVVMRLLARADVVLHSFRAGVAARLGVDEAAVRAINPNVIYHEAPGFGTAGPYGHRPAYAPTIGAGSGMARRNVKNVVPERPDLTLQQIKDGSIRMGAASMTVGHADGFSALGVSCAQMLGLLARARGLGGQRIVTTMLSTLAQILSEDMIEYEGRPAAPTADVDLLGLGPLYRLYQASDGWVFLAAPTQREWDALRRAVADLNDPRFTTHEGRTRFAQDLASCLSNTFNTCSAAEWEAFLTKADVACVAVTSPSSHEVLMRPGGLAQQLDMTVQVEHPIFGLYPRLKSVIAFSRSATRAEPGILIGQHTNQMLQELGYGADEIAALTAGEVVLQA